MNQLTTLGVLMHANVPVFIWGPPGEGKTAASLSLAKEASAYAEILIAAVLDPVDVGGYPMVQDGTVRVTPLPWARRLQAALAQGRQSWLILDELSCASPAVQAALLRVVQERRAGEVDLSGIRIIATGNPPDTAADGGWLSPAMAGRFAHLEWKPDVSSWTTGLMTGVWPSAPPPAQPTDSIRANARSSVAAFIRHSPGSLRVPNNKFPDCTGYPSRRSWVAACEALAWAGGDITTPLGVAVVSACVGEGVTSEFATWAATLDLPDPETILSQGAPWPERPDQLHVTSLAVATLAVAQHKDRRKRIETASRRIAELRPDQQVPPMSVLMTSGEVTDEAAELGDRIIRSRTRAES